MCNGLRITFEGSFWEAFQPQLHQQHLLCIFFHFWSVAPKRGRVSTKETCMRYQWKPLLPPFHTNVKMNLTLAKYSWHKNAEGSQSFHNLLLRTTQLNHQGTIQLPTLWRMLGQDRQVTAWHQVLKKAWMEHRYVLRIKLKILFALVFI